MTPTPKLRFVERIEPISTHTDGSTIGRSVKVLQQLWMPTNEPYEEWLKVKDGEWRDVPLEEEK